MSPEALRRRLAHGNVYRLDKVDAALTHYFRPGNLTALRELALLWTADRVDDALARYREEHDIAEPVAGPRAAGGGRQRRPGDGDPGAPGVRIASRPAGGEPAGAARVPR